MDQSLIKQREKDILERGWTAMRGVYSDTLIPRVCQELDQIRPVYDAIHEEQGVYEEMRNAYHHTIVLEYKKRKPPILKMPADPAQSKTTEKSSIHITTLLSTGQIT